MSVYHEKSRSCWMDIPPPKFPALEDNVSCDVAVVGSGIAGLSIAYELAKAGKSVVVLDRGPIGRGMTARTTAHITTALDDYYHVLIEARGDAAARRFFAAQAAAAERIAAIAGEEEIACDHATVEARWFLTGGLDEEDFDREWRALGEVGLSGVTKLAQATGHRLSDGPSLVVPGQGRFHPMKYLDGLAAALVRMGVKVFADTCVTKVEELKTVVHVDAGAHRVTARAAVIATNAPIMDDAQITKRTSPYRTYAIAAEAPKGSIEDVLWWDTEQPYHYVRLHPMEAVDLLIAGGADHASGAADDAEHRFAGLEQWTRERFPEIRRLRQRWSGQVLEPEDGVGFIGLSPDSERTFIVTGDSGQGIAHGVAASLILPALIDGRGHPWASVYAPAREPPKKKLARPREKKIDDEIGSENELSPGEGGILKHGKVRLAVARDEGGRVHRLSAKCSHAGCTVHWNRFEQCWDCPCHGSQFAPDGTALNAPAIGPLEPAKTPASGKKTPASASR